MTKKTYTVIHEVKCKCGEDLTVEESVCVHISVGGREWDVWSCVDQYGHLYADAPDDLIAKGLHAGSFCSKCGEQLEELVDDDAVQGEEQEQWYVRWEDGSISGPMDKKDTLHLSEKADIMIFSGKIFSQESVITPEMRELLKEFSEMRELLLETRALIVHLSREKVVVTTSEVGKVLEELENLDKYGHPAVEMAEIRRAIDMITLLSREKVVTGTIEGGVLDLDPLPEGVTVDIRDRDCEGVDEDVVEEDEEGSFFPAGQ